MGAKMKNQQIKSTRIDAAQDVTRHQKCPSVVAKSCNWSIDVISGAPPIIRQKRSPKSWWKGPTSSVDWRRAMASIQHFIPEVL